MTMTWEYHAIAWAANRPDEWQAGIARMNGLGMEGWEAIGMTQSTLGMYTVLFKRPR
jgi:hypothetical protein